MITTLVLDLETSALEADRGVILCACYESSLQPGKVVTIRQDETNPEWSRGRRGDDKELTKLCMSVVKSHDIVVAHNGARFDIPYLRTRALRWGLKPLRDVKTLDPLQVAWRKLRLRSNGLGALADHLGLSDKKTPLDLSVWADACLNGSKKAMNLIVEHCVADVKVLSGVMEHIKGYVKVFDERGSAL